MSLHYDESTIKKLDRLFENGTITVGVVSSEASQYRNSVGIGADWVSIECGSTEVESTTFTIGLDIYNERVNIDVPKDVDMDDAMKDVVDAIVRAGIPDDKETLLRIVRSVRDTNRDRIAREQSIALQLDGKTLDVTPAIVHDETKGIEVMQDGVIVATLLSKNGELRVYPNGDMDAPYIPLRP